MAGAANKAAASEIGKAIRPVMHGSDGMCATLWAANAQTACWFHIVRASFPPMPHGAADPDCPTRQTAAKSAKMARRSAASCQRSPGRQRGAVDWDRSGIMYYRAL